MTTAIRFEALVEVIEDAADPGRTKFAVFNNGRTRITDHLEHNDQMLLPISRATLGFSEILLPHGTMLYSSVTEVFSNIFKFLGYAVDIPDLHHSILTAFVLYTWLADGLATPVYPSFIGLPQSGKVCYSKS